MALTQISTAGVKDDAVTAGKIPANAVGTSEIANDAVTSTQIADNTIVDGDIADATITLNKLVHGTSSNDGKFLRANNGADPSFETVSTDLVGDTSPQLGGNLDVNTKNIVFGDSSGSSDDRLTFGAGSDLKIYHDGSNSHIRNDTGDLTINANGDDLVLQSLDNIHIRPQSGENGIEVIGDGAVELYHDNEKKLFTTSQGVDVQAEGSAVELRLKSDGGTLRGYVYGNNSNEFGFLSSAGNWPFKHTLNSKTEFYIGSNLELRIDGDGVKFNGDTAAANALSDYEEGTWTPTMTASGGNGAFPSANVSGYYTKIGNLVHVQFRYESFSDQYNVVKGNAGGSAVLNMGGLPFTVQQFLYTPHLATWGWNYPGSRSIATPSLYLYIPENSTTMQPYYVQDNSGGQHADVGALGQAYLRGQFSYFTTA